MVLKMTKDRTLIITKQGNSYQDENNAETIKIILPKRINEIDLKECYIYLSFINQQNVGNVCDITEYLQEYSDEYYVIKVPMCQMFTHEAGKVQMWVKLLHSSTEMVAKTNEVVYTIKPHKEVEGIIPEQEMSVIDGLVTKMGAITIKVNELSGTVEEIDEYVDELQQGEVLLVQPMLTAKIQDGDEGEE